MTSITSHINITFQENSLPPSLMVLVDYTGIEFRLISADRLLFMGVRTDIMKSCNVWLMDYPSFILLSEKAHDSPIEDLPEILLILEENEMGKIEELDLADNVGVVVMPCVPELFKVQIRQAQKRTARRYEKKLEIERHSSLFLNSSQAKLLVDPIDGSIIDANPAASALYDKSIETLLAGNFLDLHPRDFESFMSQTKQVLGGEKVLLALSFPKEDEDVRELEYFMNLVTLGGKGFVYLNVEDITEKEIANELFYEQAEMLRNTLESIDDLLFSLNKDGDFIDYYQPTGGSTLALSSDVFIGKNIYDVGFPLDIAQKYIFTIEQVIEEDKAEQIEYHLQAFGSQLWYNAKISPRKNTFGVIEGVTVLCRDVTLQKKSEEALKKARDFYLTMLADFPTMIWKTNNTRRADYFNKTWLEFTGNDLNTEMRTDWSGKLSATDTKIFASVLNNAYKTKQSFQLEHKLKHHSGEFRSVINAGRPFYNLDGNFAGFIGSCYDISERKKAEEMLHLQKSAMESALEGILIIKDDNESYPVIYANKELSRLTELTEKQLVGNAFLEVLGCPISEDTRSEILHALKTRTSFKGEFSCLTSNADNEVQWRLLYMAPVKKENEATNHFVAVLSDISETKTVEKTLRENNRQLQKTNQELDNFVYSTSHELRSPLMSVLGLLNLMETENDIEEDERNTYLTMIRESISRLDKIIHDIIDYSRNSRTDVLLEKIDFKTIIKEVIENHEYIEEFEKVKITTRVEDKNSFLSDAKRIRVIINNFISNCFNFHDFKQENPFIEVSVKTSPTNVLITVKDNGPGISDKHLGRIYDMFYRGTEKSKGSGIGLYIVKEIVDKLKGSIQVNTKPEEGTTFTVDLPNSVHKNIELKTLTSAETSQEIITSAN
ncbi:MAG: PAS domain S-box protein [Bacteroidetes bacterium]|nr:MAG: PAS domain S-box protein [Bacteroidota bacterium]